MMLYYFVCMIVTGSLMLNYYFGPVFIIFLIIELPRAITAGVFIAFKFNDKGAAIKLYERIITLILQILMYIVLIIMIPVDAADYTKEINPNGDSDKVKMIRGYYTWIIIGAYFILLMDLAIDIYFFFILKKYYDKMRPTKPENLQKSTNQNGVHNNTLSKIKPSNIEDEEENKVREVFYRHLPHCKLQSLFDL